MTEEETNIISDDDFLKEIFSEIKSEEKEKEQPKTDIEKLLSGEDLEDPKPPKEPAKVEEGEASAESGELSEDQIEKEEKNSFKRFGVKDTISTLIDNGIWADMPIKFGDKEYDNIEDLVEKEKPSKELFELLSQAQKKFRDDQLDETYIKVGDKTSTKAKLVNAILNDVDYTDLLEYNKEVVEPLQRIDFANITNGEKIAEAFVRQCLVDIDNYHPDSIDAVIQGMGKNFQILEKAEEYQKITIDNFNKEIEKREFEKGESIKRSKEQERESAKLLREELKSQNLSDTLSTKILKLRYTKDPSSNRYHYEDLIADKIKDKAYEAKLMYFLLDDEDFIKKEKSKVKLETSKTFMELVKSTPKGVAGKATPKGNLQTDDEDFFREIGLIND